MILARGTAKAVALAAALTLAFGCANATPQGRIVVYGAASGSHLTLGLSGRMLTVDGWMAHAQPTGCRFAGSRHDAVCPLDGIGGIELDMGPRGDFVEVAEKLPVPLTVHLGDGSDKFIGNGEPDTCYSEGARRNRCVGGGGDDICITGDQNSDCVGGDGNDYCQTGAGSDGCWGGPGDDICRMGPGQDGGHDELYGGPNADQLYGGEGYDNCDGLPGWGRSHECEAGPGR
jgi:Ca2+-binding RTX toxin-like protein